MSAPNGHAEGSRGNQKKNRQDLVSPAAVSIAPAQLTPEQIKRFVDLLEIPFDGSVIEWRVTNTSRRNGGSRGQLIPYADQRAYTDRLNALFTPAGWTRKYTVHTTANFQRCDDQKLVAKVFVTCEVTIFGVGSHSATGEGWTDDENAVTAAEAQAFKRACACFGLGRYLYYFSGIWVDLDERKQPIHRPVLTDWATPEGWRKGLRPQLSVPSLPNSAEAKAAKKNQAGERGESAQRERRELVHQIEAMAEQLGRRLYRGLLKDVARVWNPTEIPEVRMLEKVLAQMQSAHRDVHRLEAALEQADPEALPRLLRSLNLNSLNQVENLETLRRIVAELEEHAGR